jgi:hypothetical protein
MPYSPILAPVVAMVAWSIVVILWMFAVRGRAFRKAGITLANAPRGGRGVDLEGRIDPRDQWVSHNHNHLMEQPTLFYAIALTLALMGWGDGINLWLAWGYVGFRIIHSIVQSLVNIVLYRFTFYLLATLCLLGLTVHAGARIIHDCMVIAH